VTYRFGLFEFDADTNELTLEGRRVPLEPQPARALGLLLARAGTLVTRKDLRACVWGQDTHVDFDRGLSYCIGELRSALRDRADNPRFIQTLPRRGFRFIAPVATLQAADADRAAPPSPSPVPGAPLRGGRPRAAWWLAAAIAVAIGVSAWMIARRSPAAGRPIIAVAVFDNETGDASYDRPIMGLSDVVVDRLTALGPDRVGVVGNMTALRRGRADRDLREIARDTRASFIVLGQLQSRGTGLSLLLQLIRVDDGTHVWVQRIARPNGDTLVTLDEEAARLLEDAVRRHVLDDRRTS
jgi:DNA-binding winged helix-turn-helix (wHTH) protein/TolB-like protein